MTYLQVGIPIANLNPHETPQLIGGYLPGGQISKVGPQFIAGHFFGKENYATWNMNMSMTRKNLPSTPFC